MGIFSPTLWLTPIPLVIVGIVFKDIGWRKAWRETHGKPSPVVKPIQH